MDRARLGDRFRIRLLSLALSISVFVSACFVGGPIPDGAPTPNASLEPIALATSKVTLTEETPVPPGSAPLLSTAVVPVPTSAATPERAADAVIRPDQAVAVPLGARIEVEGAAWSIHFAEVVDDSRCPEDVQCIWAGQVVVRLVAEHTDGRVAALTLTMPAGGPATAMLGALRVEALGIDPMPRAGAPRPLSYVLALRVGLPQAPVSSARSGVQGRVTIGPMCPVMRVDEPCPDRPYRAILVVRDSASREVARVESSDDGAYAIPLPPGTYVMDPQSPSASRLPWASPQTFLVPAADWTILDVAFDSGIR